MKIALTVTLLAAAFVGGRTWLCGNCCPFSCAPDREPSGEYVEARTASVFAGACHYNSEYVTAGRESVLAWKFEAGRVEGVDLEGVEIVAAVASPENLAVAGARRSSVIYVDRSASERQREVAAGWLRQRHASVLGDVLAVETADVAFEREGDRYDVRVADTIELRGVAMPDRACCSMPSNVWYEPAERVDGRLVGCSDSFACRESKLGVHWSREGANDAFLGSFGSPQGCCAQSVAALP